MTKFVCRIPKKIPKISSGKSASKLPTLAELDAGVRRSQASAFAEGTLANLTTQWVRYMTFCLIYEIDPLPAGVDVLCRYAEYLSLSLKSHESLMGYISGVKTLHKLLDLPINQFSDIELKLALRGLQRNNTHIPKQAPPITPQILHDVYDLLDMDNEEDVIFWAVVLIGFFLLLRKCNLVPDTGASFNPDKQLKRSDLSIEPDHIKVTLRWTKNAQFGNKPLRFVLPRIEGSVLCPVSAILAVLSLVEGNPNDSLFKKSSGVCFTYRQLQSKLAWVSQMLDLPDKLTSHSLRAGGATNAFLAGVPGEIIKILGHWKSDCYLKYIRLPEEARFAAGVLVKHRIVSLDL